MGLLSFINKMYNSLKDWKEVYQKERTLRESHLKERELYQKTNKDNKYHNRITDSLITEAGVLPRRNREEYMRIRNR